MINHIWTARTPAERTALVFIVLGVSWRIALGFAEDGPIDTAPEFHAAVGGFVFLAMFLLVSVPVAVLVLLRGGAHFASPWRRMLDRLLPSLALAAMALALFAP